MRGTPVGFRSRGLSAGIIPAYAGNTSTQSETPPAPRDHPRVCGEHIPRRIQHALHLGSSPRMRGTPFERCDVSVRLGIIPAYAGNTCRRCCGCRQSEDHPRVCGEHNSCCLVIVRLRGSSPRMRGTPTCRVSVLRNGGIIPAYAGNTIRWYQACVTYWDHPRVCGEHRMAPSAAGLAVGSSPRMRGTPAICRNTP